MASVAKRWNAWLDLASDLAARPASEFPRRDLTTMLRATFQTRVSWHHLDGGDAEFEFDEPIPGWPNDADLDYWRTEGFAKDPLTCFYGHTQKVVPMTTRRVPTQLVPPGGAEALRQILSPVGLEEQLALPYRISGQSTRVFILSQSGEDYCDDDLELAHLIQPLIVLLDRQATLLATADCPTACAVGLTGRELAVLQLLAEGRTAVAIAHALQVSPRTVHTHLTHVYRKLGVCDRMRAVLVARELGIIA